MSKGVSKIATGALYIGVTFSVIVVAMTVVSPALENMRDAASIQKARYFMHQLDNNMQQVVSGRTCSARTIEKQFNRGEIYYENSTGAVVYALKTDVETISACSSQRYDNVVLNSSNNSAGEERTVRVKLDNNQTTRGFNGRLTRHVEITVKNIGLVNGNPVVDISGD